MGNPVFNLPTPRQSGYHFPAEWEKHESTWLSYPHNEEVSWPGRIHTIFPSYHQFIHEISKGEMVNINVLNESMKQSVMRDLEFSGLDMNRIRLHIHPNNDAWCRDHGPAFVINKTGKQKKAVVKWMYNAWGDKYPHDLDNQVPFLIAEKLGLPVFQPGIVMEGGSVDFNGNGTLLTTTSCLLNPNRNPHLSQKEIEKYLVEFYGVEQVLWLGDGIEGDDTSGHIDDITRFISEDTVVTMVEHNKKDFNHKPLKDNIKKLSKMRLTDGRQLNIVELPMPAPMYIEDMRVPVSYANFYFSNAAVIVPTFNCKEDETALAILSDHIRDRAVIGIDSTDIIWGLGSFHCLSQQEPAI